MLEYSALRTARNMLSVGMGNFFSPNIGRGGRIARAVWGAALIAVGLLISGSHPWACVGLVAFGVFALYEAARGWCVVRACGIKTKL
jgi:hypothetical protein